MKATQRTGAAATITFFASDRTVKVSIDSYLVHQYCLKGILNYSYDEIVWGMDIRKRLAGERMKNTADLRKDTRFILEWHLSALYCHKAGLIIGYYCANM